jgi:hypothetical protein
MSKITLKESHPESFPLNFLKSKKSPNQKFDPRDLRKHSQYLKRFSWAMVLGGINGAAALWTLKLLQVPYWGIYFAPVAAVSVGYVYWELCRIKLDADRYLFRKELERKTGKID